MSHKLCAATLLLVLVAVAESAVKVPVTVYYESLCTDSQKLITEQIFPSLQSELKEYVDITWVPFGKSSYSTQGSDVLFTCHHGPNECYGNKVHACAIEHIQANSYQIQHTRESLTLDFINCLMKAGKNFPDNVYPGARCALENQISIWENIQQCANSTEGSQLLKKHGDTTNHFQQPLDFVPTVVFQQQFDAKTSELARSNFFGTVCNYIAQPKPQVCMSLNSAAGITFIPLLGVLGFALSRLF